MAEKAPALRDSDGIDAMHGRSGLRIVFQIGKKIAHSREAEPSHDGVFCSVYDLIYFPGLKSAVQMNEMRIGHKFAVHGVSKTPLVARNRLPRTIGRVANRQDIFCTCRIIDGIAFSSDWSEKGMAARHILHFLCGREIRTHQAANFFSSGIVSNRSKKAKVFPVIGDVKFPADPSN